MLNKSVYRVRYLFGTTLKQAYIQSDSKEEAQKSFLSQFSSVEPNHVIEVHNIINEKKELDVSKFVNVFIGLFIVVGFYFVWKYYKEDVKYVKNIDYLEHKNNYAKPSSLNILQRVKSEKHLPKKDDIISTDLTSHDIQKSVQKQEIEEIVEEGCDDPLYTKMSDTIYLENQFMLLQIKYQIIDNIVHINLEAKNKIKENVKGGVSISFPTINRQHRVFDFDQGNFDSLESYSIGKKIWHRKQRQSIKASYLLVEAWSKYWKANERKRASFVIDVKNFKHLKVQVRGILILDEEEFVLPNKEIGVEDQQGYIVKRIGIDLPNINNTSIYQKEKSLKNIKITNYIHPEDEPKGLYIVDLQIGDRSKTYRLYCPKKMVRDITNNTYGKSRSIEDEDSIVFSGKSVLRKAYQKICSTASSHHQAYHTQQTVISVIVNRTDVGTVRGISRNGDGFVAVRGGPGTGYAMIDKLYSNDEKVTIAATKGKWKGIVYGHANCKQGLSKQRGEPYAGSCKTGWVYGKYINVINKKFRHLTKKEKRSLLYQLLDATNEDKLKYSKVGIQEFLRQRDPDTYFVKGDTRYEHTCVQMRSNYFKCKFGDYFNDGEDEGMIVTEYDVIKKDNKVKIKKIYTPIMAD